MYHWWWRKMGKPHLNAHPPRGGWAIIPRRLWTWWMGRASPPEFQRLVEGSVTKAKWILSIFYSIFEIPFPFHSQSTQAIFVYIFPSPQNLSESSAAGGGFTGQFFSWFSFLFHVFGASFKLPIWMEIELGSLGRLYRPQESPARCWLCQTSYVTAVSNLQKETGQADLLPVQHAGWTSKVHLPGTTS